MRSICFSQRLLKTPNNGLLQSPLATWQAACSGTICAELWVGKAMKASFRDHRSSSEQIYEKFSLPFKPLYWGWQSVKDDDTFHLEISVYPHASMWNSGCLWTRLLFFWQPPAHVVTFSNRGGQQHQKPRRTTLLIGTFDKHPVWFFKLVFSFFKYIFTYPSMYKYKFMH